MNIWVRLSPDQTHDFQVPWDIANQPQNQFYSTATLNNLYFDGPWLLLSIRPVSEMAHVVSFQPCIVEFHYINEFDAYNPLHHACGQSLSLSRRERLGLAELLGEYGAQMMTAEQRPFAPFTPLHVDQWSAFHLPTSGQWHKRTVYIQTTDPIGDQRPFPMTTLLVVTKAAATNGRFAATSALQTHLQLCQFPTHALQQPQYNPLTTAQGKVELDAAGMRALSQIIAQSAIEQPVGHQTPPATRPLPLFPLR